jgi:type III restriction enzyme
MIKAFRDTWELGIHSYLTYLRDRLLLAKELLHESGSVTAVTRRLLEHWRDETAREHPFYFCQLEAIETLIWWVEGPQEYRQGIFVPGDGGLWERICNKMATGAGKTTVMAMIITWQALNALTYPNRKKDFSKSIFIVAPGLTVKDRLRVLYTGEPDNYYDDFGLCPPRNSARN